MNPTVELAIRVLVFLMMVTVGMDLRFRDFQRVRDHPRLVPGVVIGHWVALLIVGGFLGRSLALPDEVTGGVLLVAAAPAAALSCFYAQLAAGDLALATTLAAVSNALAFIATPLVATVGFHLFMGSSNQFDLPLMSVAQHTFVGLLLPLLAGMLIRHRLGVRLDFWRGPTRAVGLVAVVSVLAIAVVDDYTTIRAQFVDLLRAAIALTMAMLVVGVIVARVVSTNARDRSALPWAFAARNAPVAVLIATSVGGTGAMVSFVAVLFATQLTLLVPIALFAGHARARLRPEQSVLASEHERQ
ncbi:MAG: bile acid:sodium symporter [Deltaproteobacteria bacterium]|jgi:BASS family bile acid:Na+ symporter|nr:bile acid:sodium symporter [Deltaproteobacteria bacterium]